MKQSLLAVMVAGGLFSAALFSTSSAVASELTFPHIDTVGVSELTVEPDMAELRVEVSVTEADPKIAKAKSDEAVAKFIERLRASGVTKEQIQSANLNLQPQYRYEQNRERELVGYSASREIVVAINDLARLNPILDSALEEGINRVNNIALKSSKEAEYVAQARQAAIKDAKQKALSLAQGFDQTLGGVWEIRYFDQTPVRPVMYKAAMMADNAVNESYQYGQVIIQDRVEVVFKLK